MNHEVCEGGGRGMNQEPCAYCTTVNWETDSPYDRDKLIDKKKLARDVVINNSELLVMNYHIGYFGVKERKNINYCPMCGRKLATELN